MNGPEVDPSAEAEFHALLTGSFARALGRPLMPEAGRDAAWLYAEAPFAVLAHDRSDEPRFIYANLAAQRAFGYARAEILGLPSRLSAEAPDRAERQRLLDAVARDGFVAHYEGIRIREDGTRFALHNGIVWQLIDEAGVLHGQAATFPIPVG